VSAIRVRLGRYEDGVWWWELVDMSDEQGPKGYVITDGLEDSWEKARAVADAYYRAETMRTPR
jgi:hypothetical protein